MTTHLRRGTLSFMAPEQMSGKSKIIKASQAKSYPTNAILIIHKERYERPVKDERGKFLRMKVSNQLGKKFYCVKKIS